MNRTLILGPPGTGKTTTLIALVRGCGVPTERIAYVLFGKKASEDVRERLGAPPRRDAMEGDDHPWFRTIHSMAFALLGLMPDQVMSAEHWQMFAQQHGYKFSDMAVDIDGRPSTPARTPDDGLRAMYEWARNRKIDLTQALKVARSKVNRRRLLQYVKRLVAYKSANGVLDFTDMIEDALRVRGPSVDLVIIDEAQDLSPLEWDAVSTWFAGVSTVYIAGDDDQALYGFKAADSSVLVDLAKRFELRVLGQSHRVPRGPFAYAAQIITRNKARVPKDYRPREADGVVKHVALRDAVRAIDAKTSTLVLARNRCFLEEPAAELRRLNVPFRREGAGVDLLDPEDSLAKAYRTAQALLNLETVTGQALRCLLRFVPSDGPSRLVSRGCKKIVSERRNELFSVREVEALLEGAALLRVLRVAGPGAVLKKAHRDDLTYVERVLKKYGDDAFQPTVTLTTIHASKGREAHTVIIIPDVTKATFKEMQDARHGGAEAENRVAYVAVTRAIERLYITRPRSTRAYPYPTPRRAA